MRHGWLILLIISTVMLAIVLVRTRISIRWFGYALLHLVLAAVALFLINGSGWFGEFYIPINTFTVFTVGILGVPGLALLVALKLTLI